MNTNIKMGWAVLAGLLILLPVSVSAKDMGMYGGLGFGYSVLEVDAPNTDRASTAGKLYFGARVLGPLGVEAAYYDLGKYNSGDDKVTGTGITAVGNLDTKSAMLFIKAGVIDWTVEDVPNGTEVTGTDITYGLGINLALEKNLVFRAELEHFSKIGKDDATATPGNNMKLLSFGVNFKF